MKRETRKASKVMRLKVFEDGKKIFEDGEVVPDPECFSSRDRLHFRVRSQSENGFQEYNVDVGKKWNPVNCDCHFGVTHGRKSKMLMDQDTGGICKHMVAVIHYISENRGALENLAENADTPERGSP